VDLARSATRTASPAESSRPSIFNCRAVPKREKFSNLTSTHCRRKKNRNMALLFVCVSIKVRAKEGEGRSFALKEEWVRQPCLVPLVSNKPKLEEKD